jgi:transcriptional regulator with XRE-family HTH domain
MPSGRQIRAARVLADWGAEDLARKIGLSRVTIQNIEHGVNKRPKIETINKIIAAFSEVGIEFIDGDGVRRRATDVRIFEGIHGFAEFYEVVYTHLKEHGGEACVCGSSSSQFAKYRPNVDTHRARMIELARQNPSFKMRFLAEEGDYNLPNTSYASYRWMPKENFPPVAFYSFGEYKAEITFSVENPPLIILVKSLSIAESYRKFFNFMWSNAKEVAR